jgi:hypothetical protein
LARLRMPETADKDAPSIPVELTDHYAPVWHDPALFAVWCRRHLGGQVPEGPPIWGPAQRATWQWRDGVASHAWAERNGRFMNRFAPAMVSHVSLAQVGIKTVAVPERGA